MINLDFTNVEIQDISSIFAPDKAKELSKIMIIGPAFPLRGGLATYNERLARQFISEGDEVTIFTFSLQYPSLLFPGKTQYSESKVPKDLDIHVNINSINPFNWIVVGRKLAKEDADIIIVRYWLPFMAPCLGTILRIARKPKTKILAITDNIIPHERKPGDNILTRYFLKSIDSCISMSESVLVDLRKFSNMPAQVVKHPLYDNFGTKIARSEACQKLNLPADKFIFLFFGFIRKYKGLELLIDAIELLNPVKNNCVLVIAGEYYAGEKELSEKIKSCTYKEQIFEHTHFINDDEVSIYFSAANAVVQPYLHATQSGVTPLAYHFEVPMIVTNVGALPDMVPEGIGLIAQPEAHSLATAMKEMLYFDTTTFEKTIKKEKSKYDWSIMTAAIRSSL